MKLTVFIDEEQHDIDIPDFILSEAKDYFDMMDKDMDQGYQMSRSWVENPDLFQRCQIAGDKILTAIQTENRETSALMAGYILSRVPQAKTLYLTQNGDMTEHDLET
ncbi:hypothetical protein [Leucothrix pacifica]|uniref:Uncharacterized protein n=1 Tax=Leucothrix pacifica TaxID=1247513 RepID=A0A317C9Q0_9GAMM|nr:hypothetical protein [Leucothrix pacifica]PWQ92782.1 hypothetical protein DKW60_19430 [Leucothrix pacifica]